MNTKWIFLLFMHTSGTKYMDNNIKTINNLRVYDLSEGNSKAKISSKLY